MELRQLEYLVAVADARTFTAAAAKVRVAQPAVSAQIAVLEREVGQTLFTRTSRGAVPTEAGTELVQHARAVLSQLDDARAAMAELAGVVRGQVRVGTVRGAPLGRLAGLLGRFRTAHPDVGLTLHEGESDTMVGELRAGTLDLAVVGLAGPAPADLTTRTLFTAPVAAFVPPSHRWARRKVVGLTDLAAHRVVTLPGGTGVRAALDAACRAHDVALDVGFEVGTVGAALELARAGLGVAVLPGGRDDRVLRQLAPDLHAVTLRPAVHSRLALAWARSTPRRGRPAARALVALAGSEATGRSGSNGTGAAPGEGV